MEEEFSDKVKKFERLADDKTDKYRKRRKRSEDISTADGVLDLKTAQTLAYFIDHDKIEEMGGVISTGKEAHVYYATAGSEIIQQFDITELAVKVYRVSTLSFKKIDKYIIGDPRFLSIRKGSTQRFMEQWAKKEYRNLKKCEEVGVAIPRPLEIRRNVFVMEYIPDSDGQPARLLKEVEDADFSVIAQTVLGYVQKMYREIKLVHADLSEYNILLKEDKVPILIDFSQGVLEEHPMADYFLISDLKNLYNFFSSKNVDMNPIPELFKEITDREPQASLLIDVIESLEG
ncbi:MAG: serine protein kinase RIO [Candidatus Hodarchaeota archaeon]